MEHHQSPGVRTGSIYQCTDRDGNVWLLSRDAHIVRLLGNKYENLPLDSGIGSSRASLP